MIPIRHDSTKPHVRTVARIQRTGSETVLVASLSASACILLLLILAVSVRKYSRPVISQDRMPSAPIEEEVVAKHPEDKPAAPRGPEDTAPSAPEATQSAEGDVQMKADVLASPSPTRRRELARDLDSISRPRRVTPADDENDPFAVYRVIRDNCEFITSVLIELGKYADSGTAHRVHMLEIEKTHIESLKYEYDDNYCSFRIAASLEANARLSVLLARSLNDAGTRKRLDALEAQLQALPKDGLKQNAVCAEVAALAWEGVLRRMAQTAQKEFGPFRIQDQLTSDGGTMARLRSSFQSYAGLLEQGARSICPGAAGQINRLRIKRQQAEANDKSTFICIAAATESLAEAHERLARSM